MTEYNDLIMKGQYDFQGEVLSPEVIDLIKKLMCVSVTKRLSAEEALKHPWLQKT